MIVLQHTPGFPAPFMNMVRYLASLIIYALLAATGGVWAQQTAPGETIKILMPSDKNTVSESIARLITEELSIHLGTPIELVALPEQHLSTNTERTFKAKPDGNTLILSWFGSTITGQTPFHTLPFDPETDLDTVGMIAEIPNILVVNTKLPVSTLGEFTAYVHAHPGAVNFGSDGNGRSTHLAGQMYMLATDTNMVHVSYSSPDMAMSNLVSGQIQAIFQLASRVLRPIREDQVRALGVMSRQRLPALPDLPTMPELGYPSLISGLWYGLSAPRGTPEHVVQAMNEALNAILIKPRVTKRLEHMGALVLQGSSTDMKSRLSDDINKWRKIMITTDLPIH